MILRLSANALETDALLAERSASFSQTNKSDDELLQATIQDEFRKKPLRFTAYAITIGTYVLLLALVILLLSPFHARTKIALDSDHSRETSFFDELDRFIIREFDSSPTTSNFLSGIAGLYGKPMYAYYVNRGQCIASFGTMSKDYPIMEFNSANKAYKTTPLEGFRTFIQGDREGRSFIFEPFSPLRTLHENGDHTKVKERPQRTMYLGASEVQIQEVDSVHKLETNVTYFILPEEKFGAFVREVTITNHDPVPVTLSFLDGLAQIEPYGGKLNALLKNMGRTLEAWFGVYQVYNDTIAYPFYKLSSQPADTADVLVVNQGHFCISFLEDGSNLNPIIYDTSKVFGEDSSLIQPLELFSKSISEIISGPQFGFAKTASAFAAISNVTLKMGQSIKTYTVFGLASDMWEVPRISRQLTTPGFMALKRSRAREIHNKIMGVVETRTANQLFDAHVKQMYLDNSLRGGIPMILGKSDNQEIPDSDDADENKALKVYHVFSRVHGDLERDYNDFVIDSTFYSQGPGNFRDVAQNRRNDVIFNPRIGSFNARLFLSLIQSDGYNPLTVEGVVFSIKDKDLCDSIAERSVGNADGHRAQREALSHILSTNTFRPGQLLQLIEDKNIDLVISPEEFINLISRSADVMPMATFKDGYWADHFTYILDLIETYVSIYPDREEDLMFRENIPYFFSPVSVRSREEKYHLIKDETGKSKRVLQFNATMLNKDREAEKMRYYDNQTKSYSPEAYWQHDCTGRIVYGTAISKLLVLATLKFATRDPYGMGIEYEAGKPGWNDALNGLVGKIGSGMPETFELENLLRYILSLCSRFEYRKIDIPAEVYELIDAIERSLSDLDATNNTYIMNEPKVPNELFTYWDSVSKARETYRAKVSVNFSGEISSLEAKHVSIILSRWLEHISYGKLRALGIGALSQIDSDRAVMPTYFYFDVSDFEIIDEKDDFGNAFVKALGMRVRKMPLFLEGPTRMLKTVTNPEALSIYHTVRNSALRDEKLGMYTISDSLAGLNYDLGRIVSFPPGWLENQSVWTHMSYKFYLELLRNGLYEEFFSEMKGGGMLPFMEPNVYGRSILECSSFLTSSSFSDSTQSGRGFLARLSGATSEFMSIWTLMMLGRQPYYVEPASQELRFTLRPSIPLWLFMNNTYSLPDGSQSSELIIEYKLFSTIDVTYHNTVQRDLFDVIPKRYEIQYSDESAETFDEYSLPSSVAMKIRRVIFVRRMDVYF